MKKALLAVLLVFFFCSVAVAAIKDSPDGFRGIKWGQSPAALGENAILVDSSGKKSFYYIKGDNCRIGEADVDCISYFFWDNKFITATILAEGEFNSSALKAAMIEWYGEQYDLDSDGEHVWSDDNAYITLTIEMGDTITSATITSVPLLKAMIEDEDEEAKKGVKGF